MTDHEATPAGEPPAPPPGSFGDAAAEMSNETEVEVEVDPGSGDAVDAGGEAGEIGDVELEDDLDRARRDLGELTTDLQRLQAEYLNYKRRVERDRDLVRENATYAALTPIVEVLDNIDRAREHGPLDEGFKAVAEQLERTVAALGLTKFGEAGDAFDPNVHEALSHVGQDPEVTVTTCKIVAKSGYKIGDRVVRAAQVLVVDPAEA